MQPKRTLLDALLVLNALFILACAGGLAVRVRRLLLPTPAARAPLPPKSAPGKDSLKKETANAQPPASAPQAPAKEPSPSAEKPSPPPQPVAQTPPDKPAGRKTAPAAAAKAPAKSVSKPVDFSYSDPSAKDVSLLGAFLVRSNGRKAMFKDSSGEWRLTVYLLSDTTYTYRFESVDGQGKRHVSKKQSVAVP